MSSAVAIEYPRSSFFSIFSKNQRIAKKNEQGSIIIETKVDERYFTDSQMYELKGGFSAELIKDPGPKFMKMDLLQTGIEELGFVLLSAFGKTKDDAKEFLSGNKFTKVAMWVDWLIVVRKNSRPVAFGSGTFINPSLFYINAGMALPEYHATGIGFIANALLWDVVLEENKDIQMVVRTHNRNVASLFLNVVHDAKISTEKLDDYSKNTFEKTAEYLHCTIDEYGISQQVYPMGLPEGTKTSCERINDTFVKVGPRDACYLTGKLDFEHIQRILAIYLKPKIRERELAA